MTGAERRALLTRYSRGEITGVDIRNHLGGVTYGEVLRLLADAGLSLPEAPTTGREERIALARSWLFPRLPDG